MGSVLHRELPPLQVMPHLNEFPRRKAACNIRSSVLSLQKVVRLQTTNLNILPKITRCGLGEHAPPAQKSAVINNLPRFGGDPTVGRMIPWGGGMNYILLELLVRNIKLHLGAPGKGERESLCPLLVPL